MGSGLGDNAGRHLTLTSSSNETATSVESMDQPRQFVLERTGEAPFRFTGRELAGGTTQAPGEKLDRAYSIAIYCDVVRKRVVAQVRYHTKWNTESEAATVYDCNGLDELAHQLLAHDPMQYVIGYPLGKQFADKQERLERVLRLHYQSLVSRLLVEIDDKLNGS
jgi:hypothetical protein